MHGVEEAYSRIKSNVTQPKPLTVKLRDGLGLVLASDIRSPLHSPSFNNSAMDGYALRFADYEKGKPIRIIGEVAAGDVFSGKLKSGEAVRIFTGAAVPPGADTVVMQEKTSTLFGNLIIEAHQFSKGLNIRLAGSQIRKGKVALSRGHQLNPASIGYLASLGIHEVKVYGKPKVAVVVTGSELIAPGNELKPGQIYESNSSMLVAVLEKNGFTETKIIPAPDRYQDILKAFDKALEYADVILFTGGISVGDYDFVGDVLKKHRVKEVFYKIKQKPGKPIYFGVKNKKPVFGLPGNPASVLTCFYEYVLPALKIAMNHPQPFPTELLLPLKGTYRKKPGMTYFLKAKTDLKSVEILPGQESYLLSSFADANCLVVLDESTELIQNNHLVKVHLII